MIALLPAGQRPRLMQSKGPPPMSVLPAGQLRLQGRGGASPLEDRQHAIGASDSLAVDPEMLQTLAAGLMVVASMQPTQQRDPQQEGRNNK